MNVKAIYQHLPLDQQYSSADIQSRPLEATTPIIYDRLGRCSPQARRVDVSDNGPNFCRLLQDKFKRVAEAANRKLALTRKQYWHVVAILRGAAANSDISGDLGG